MALPAYVWTNGQKDYSVSARKQWLRENRPDDPALRSSGGNGSAVGGDSPFYIEFIPDFTPYIVPKMIEAGMEVLKDAVGKSLKHAIGNQALLKQKSRSTGGLFESTSVSHTFIRDRATRFQANIYFKGNAPNGMRYGERAAYKEYGTPNGDRQGRGQVAASDFASNAYEAVRSRMNAVMKAVLENELKNI